MENLAGFSVHQRGSPHNLSTENLSDCLMPETYAEYGNGLVKMLNDFFGNAGIRRDPGACINPAFRGFQFSDELHGSHFWSARKSSGRETGHQRVPTVHVIAQFSLQCRCEMHNVGVTLDKHQVFDAYRPVF